MIGKRFDNPTVCNSTATANFDHALKFYPHRRQSSDAVVHFAQVSARNLCYRFTVLFRKFCQFQEFTDRLLMKPKFAAMQNEAEPCDMFRAVSTLVACGARRRWYQTNLLVVSDRRHLTVGFLRKLTDCQNVGHAFFP